jgi:hypothetical protein
MQAKRCARVGDPAALIAVAALLAAATAAAGEWDQATDRGSERAAWLLGRDQLGTALVAGEPLEQTQIGGTQLETSAQASGGGGSKVLPILMSAVLPGAGEAYMGYKRGWFMMAADLACWYGVYHYNQQGDDKKEEYLAYADAHWSEAKFRDAYTSPSSSEYLDSIGLDYYGDQLGDDGLPPLWVSKEDDTREYYENLGKWDQFVFGWDDFRRPDDPPLGIDYDVTGGVIDLQQPWISRNREVYRQMRKDSNDAYDTRDTLLYVNIGLRVFSVFQVAYLQGLLGGGGGQNELRVAGHAVEIIAEPRGWTSSRLGAAVSF